MDENDTRPVCKLEGCSEPVGNWSADGAYVPIDSGLCDAHHEMVDGAYAYREMVGPDADLLAKGDGTFVPEDQPWTPTALGKQVGQVGDLDLIPWRGKPGMVVKLRCTEFTSLCPVTGQRDMGVLEIEYTPRNHLVETKSLKLWLAKFANRPAFNEVLVDAIASHLFERLGAVFLEVRGTFNVRGGIVPIATAQRHADGRLSSSAKDPKDPPLLGTAVDQ